MKAIQVAGKALVWADFDRPQCGPGELRIKVAASAINRADLLQRNRLSATSGASPIMGLECSGTVTELGEGVSRCHRRRGLCAAGWRRIR